MTIKVNCWWNSERKYQYLAIIAINILSLAQGAHLAWPSPMIPYLRSDETHLTDGPITSKEASWIGSVFAIGTFIAIFTFDVLISRVGRKNSLLFAVLPNLIACILIYFSRNIWFLFVARFIAGLTSGGILRIIPILTGEIAESKIRGTLGFFLPFSLLLGSLLMFVIGGYLGFHTPALIIGGICIFSSVAIFLLPNTPYFFLSKGENERALKSLMFYRNLKESSDIVREELENLETALQNFKGEKITIKDFLGSENRRAISMGFFLAIIGPFSGNAAIVTYTADIFIKSGSSLSPNESAMIIGAIQLIGIYAATLTTDKFGRKILMSTSCLGSSLLLFILAAYDFMISLSVIKNSTTWNWIPIVSLSMAVFVMSLGITSVPLVMMSELVSHKIREVSMMLFMGALIATNFINLYIFPIMLDIIYIYGCFWLYSAICFAGALIVMLFLPETKGKNIFES